MHFLDQRPRNGRQRSKRLHIEALETRALLTALPVPDHIVVVIEENHSFSDIIGSSSAPYINSLAQQGALMTDSTAVEHPSQPNYLDLFSGSDQGVTSDNTPTNIPFTTPNLGAELLNAGQSFTTYSESLPSTGFNGDSFSTVAGQNQYMRKHNPATNWMNSPAGMNQLPTSADQPFTNFPTSDFSQLPTVSFVVPNEQHDMHDGTIQQADSWLQTNLGSYVQWAKTHNSLLIVTWDENDGSAGNQIPTLFVGPMVQPGSYADPINHYNVLRTIEDMYGLTYAGASATATPITSIFTPADTPSAPTLEAADDTGVSQTDGITQHNGSATAPLDFVVNNVLPADSYVQLYNVNNPASPVPLGSPVQASGGSATITLNGSALPDGVYHIAATAAATSGGTQSALSSSTTISIQTSLTIQSTNPADGTAVQSLPNGQVVVTFTHPLAGLTSGGPALSASDPYGLFLLARGPSGTFSAPSGLDSGDLPLPTQTRYVVNANGTSSIIITPTSPLSTDVFLIEINLHDFSDLAGNPLTDAQGGFRTFLLQPPPVTNSPLAVTSVTTFNGFATVNNNAIFQPDTFTIHFNKALFPGAAGGNNVQLIANPGPNFSIVPSVAAYSPTTDSIELTPTALLSPGTVYVIHVAPAVSDDQGFGLPGATLGHDFYDSFTVMNNPIGAGTSPLEVATDSSGNPRTLPASNVIWTQPFGYASIAFTEGINLNAAGTGRYSVMVVPAAGGLNPNGFDSADVPVDATVAFNPNTDLLIIVPSQPTGNDLYLYSLSNLQAPNGDPLLNNAGQPAGISGNAPYFETFKLTVSSPSAVIKAIASPVIIPAPTTAVQGALPAATPALAARVTVRPRLAPLHTRPNVRTDRPAGPHERPRWTE